MHRHTARSTRRILVVANETVESRILHDAIRTDADGEGTEILIVAPALNSRVRHWVSDEDEARNAAKARLGRSLARLVRDGVAANGWVGDADPIQAIDDALHVFPADSLIIATHPEDRSNWLARRLVLRARRRFQLPVLHIVVDAAEQNEYVVAAA
jgi:GABA permease